MSNLRRAHTVDRPLATVAPVACRKCLQDLGRLAWLVRYRHLRLTGRDCGVFPGAVPAAWKRSRLLPTRFENLDEARATQRKLAGLLVRG